MSALKRAKVFTFFAELSTPFAGAVCAVSEPGRIPAGRDRDLARAAGECAPDGSDLDTCTWRLYLFKANTTA